MRRLSLACTAAFRACNGPVAIAAITLSVPQETNEFSTPMALGAFYDFVAVAFRACSHVFSFGTVRRVHLTQTEISLSPCCFKRVIRLVVQRDAILIRRSCPISILELT